MAPAAAVLPSPGGEGISNVAPTRLHSHRWCPQVRDALRKLPPSSTVTGDDESQVGAHRAHPVLWSCFVIPQANKGSVNLGFFLGRECRRERIKLVMVLNGPAMQILQSTEGLSGFSLKPLTQENWGSCRGKPSGYSYLSVPKIFLFNNPQTNRGNIKNLYCNIYRSNSASSILWDFIHLTWFGHVHPVKFSLQNRVDLCWLLIHTWDLFLRVVQGHAETLPGIWHWV